MKLIRKSIMYFCCTIIAFFVVMFLSIGVEVAPSGLVNGALNSAFREWVLWNISEYGRTNVEFFVKVALLGTLLVASLVFDLAGGYVWLARRLLVTDLRRRRVCKMILNRVRGVTAHKIGE